MRSSESKRKMVETDKGREDVEKPIQKPVLAQGARQPHLPLSMFSKVITSRAISNRPPVLAMVVQKTPTPSKILAIV